MYKKVIGIAIFLFLIIAGPIVLINLYGPGNFFSDPGGELPSASHGLRIKDESVYTNGSVKFSIYCFFNSYKEYPVPKEDLYFIKKVFVCLEDDLLVFNKSFGEIKDMENVTGSSDDFDLGVNEEIIIQFQVSYSLQRNAYIYVGVFANDSGGYHRWDKYTQILDS
jgi:hypothetical protein